ncbi:hypothetical protein Pelo_7631 [Pelomyxa schiedti]|nr:hypothetical protein Pelo_7631 [Pelomyxa schiedti]
MPSYTATKVPQQKFQGLVGPVKHYLLTPSSATTCGVKYLTTTFSIALLWKLTVMPIMFKDLSPFTLQLLKLNSSLEFISLRACSAKLHGRTMEGASPWVRELMSQKRDLNRVLHFSDPAENPDDRLRSIRWIVDYLNWKFTTLWHPGRNVTIDEAIIPFKGVKVFMLADEYSAIVKFIVYDGKNPYGDLDKNKTLKCPFFRHLHLEKEELCSAIGTTTTTTTIATAISSNSNHNHNASSIPSNPNHNNSGCKHKHRPSTLCQFRCSMCSLHDLERIIICILVISQLTQLKVSCAFLPSHLHLPEKASSFDHRLMLIGWLSVSYILCPTSLISPSSSSGFTAKTRFSSVVIGSLPLMIQVLANYLLHFLTVKLSYRNPFLLPCRSYCILDQVCGAVLDLELTLFTANHLCDLLIAVSNGFHRYSSYHDSSMMMDSPVPKAIHHDLEFDKLRDRKQLVGGIWCWSKTHWRLERIIQIPTPEYFDPLSHPHIWHF